MAIEAGAVSADKPTDFHFFLVFFFFVALKLRSLI